MKSYCCLSIRAEHISGSQLCGFHGVCIDCMQARVQVTMATGLRLLLHSVKLRTFSDSEDCD